MNDAARRPGKAGYAVPHLRCTATRLRLWARDERNRYGSARNFSATSAAPWRSRSTCSPPGKRTMLLLAGDHRVAAARRTDRDDAIGFAMQDQHRHLHARDALVGAELVLHQKPHREKRIARRRDIDRGCERRIEDQARDRLLGRERDRDAGAERLAPQRRCAPPDSARAHTRKSRARRRSGRLRSACRSSRHSRDSSAPEARRRRATIRWKRSTRRFSAPPLPWK